MDTTTLPDLLKILANPYMAGSFFSWICAQTAFFQDEKQAPAKKIGMVILISLLWSAAVFVMGDGPVEITKATLRTVIENGLNLAFGMTVFHALVNKVLPGITDFFLKLRSGLPKTIESVSVNAEGYSQSKRVEKNTEQPSAPPEPIIAPPPVESEITLPPDLPQMPNPFKQPANDVLYTPAPTAAGLENMHADFPDDPLAKG